MKKFAFVLIFLLLTAACQTPKETTKPDKHECGPPIRAYFCPKDNCKEQLIKAIDNAEYSVHCAFYDIDLPDLISKLSKKAAKIDVKMVLDSDNYFGQAQNIPIILDDKDQLTHNKFCIIDNHVVSTGSFNPTERGDEKNNNNLIIISSKLISLNYEDEFQELWDRRFGRGNKVKYPEIIYNGNSISNFFCPEDKCAQHLIKEILDAKASVYFMVFTLTDESVADAILFSKAADIRGIFEKFQAAGRYSQYGRLKGFGLDVSLDNNSAFLHHKVFIIDNSTVITGSYNPTWAGSNRNDENMLIIRSKKLAEDYIKEFHSLKQQSI
ncbi:hypothetical protein GF323_01915 [Candidatus Woesearchaeota archaeon]|nr:hypothetical protein [Candidatus Woesearchaeota archaeon]